MLTFQDQQLKDLDEVFFNAPAKEFVEPHLIAGIRGGTASPAVTCNVIVDYERFMEQRISSKSENVNLNGLMFFIKKSEWPESLTFPRIGGALSFDGQLYTIEAVGEDMGMLEVTLIIPKGRMP